MNPEITRKAAQVKRFFKKDRLALKKKFNMECSLFRKSNEDKPCMSLSWSGDFKIDIIKALIVGGLIFLGMLAVCASIKLIFCKKK